MINSELLLPVGNYNMCLAAIHNGADAVYVGMPTFNARGRSHDHSWDELKEIIDTCHLYGVKVHLAFNILIFEDEIEQAIQTLDMAMALGPDAFIVQDLGLVNLIKSRYPNMIIHGSTQMTVTNHEAIELLDDLDIKRFVLGRENSIPEIKQIKEKTSKELEVFVHGALCVAYSGQCFTSESLGGRSANRGQCAQSCRFDYEIYVDDKKKELGNIKYLVSPKDLCGIEEVPTLQDIGVASFKVEGRLKSPEYVATVAKNYKHAITGNDVTNEQKSDMASTYSRGFYTGWLHGVAHQELSHGDTKSHRGWFLGAIEKVVGKTIYIDNKIQLNNGDGVLIETIRNGIAVEIGERIYHVQKMGGLTGLELGPKIDLKKIKVGDKIFLNRKENVIKDSKKSVTDKNLLKKIPIDIKIECHLNSPLKFWATDGKNLIQLETQEVIQEAKKSPVDKEQLIKGISTLGHTIYEIKSSNISLKGNCFIHNKVLKDLKNKMVEGLNEKRIEVKAYEPIKHELKRSVKAKIAPTKLNVLIRKKEQLDSVLEFISDNPDYKKILNSIILDFEFGKDYFPSVKLIKKEGIKAGIATTRILKPNEYHNFTLIKRCDPDLILVRNLGALNYFKNDKFDLIGDFSLNSANSQTHSYIMSKGLKSLTASYDLNIDRLNLMMDRVDVSTLEITIHQYMPEFHMEHCVFAAFLSDGNSFRDCGKPCEKHEVYLKDMYGNRHEIKADQECRNTMFNSKAQSTSKFLDDWKNKGIGFFRIESLHESPEEFLSKLKVYLKFMNGEINSNMVHHDIGLKENYGLGVGHLGFVNPYQDRKKK